MGMYSDVDRLRGILKDLAGLVNEPNSLPDATRDYINVCLCVCVCVCVCVERERERSVMAERKREREREVCHG